MSLFYRAVFGLVVVSLLGGQALADSVVIDAPGMKVEKRTGWFGAKSTSYQDALGNKVERNRGLFGRESTHTKVFGTEAITSPRETTVVDANGNPLVSTKKTWFHGKQTRVDGNAMLNSLRGLFQP